MKILFVDRESHYGGRVIEYDSDRPRDIETPEPTPLSAYLGDVDRLPEQTFRTRLWRWDGTLTLAGEHRYRCKPFKSMTMTVTAEAMTRTGMDLTVVTEEQLTLELRNTTGFHKRRVTLSWTWRPMFAHLRPAWDLGGPWDPETPVPEDAYILQCHAVMVTS